MEEIKRKMGILNLAEGEVSNKKDLLRTGMNISFNPPPPLSCL